MVGEAAAKLAPVSWVHLSSAVVGAKDFLGRVATLWATPSWRLAPALQVLKFIKNLFREGNTNSLYLSHICEWGYDSQ
jgi:hypothetical protein